MGTVRVAASWSPITATGGSLEAAQCNPKQQASLRAPRWKRKRIPGYTPEAETAEELNQAVRTLRKWRQLGIGPPYIKVGRQIHYSDESRASWLKSREVQTVHSQAAA